MHKTDRVLEFARALSSKVFFARGIHFICCGRLCYESLVECIAFHAADVEPCGTEPPLMITTPNADLDPTPYTQKTSWLTLLA